MRAESYVPALVLLAVACGDAAQPAAGAAPAASATSEPPTTTPSDTDAGPTDAASSCTPFTPPLCSSAPPFVGPERAWRHGAPALGLGSANHRGRDQFVNPGSPQWVIGRFAYGKALAETKVKDEEVDVWVNRDCATGWEKMATVTTTDTPAHAAEEGIEDEAGRIFYEIPENKRLGIGRHRVRLVMVGDLSWTELFIEVVPAGTPMFVSDVDGTLTTSESVEFTALLTGSLSPANDGAPEALSELARRGYRPMYLTARPEWLVERTREFVQNRGFPPGIIHTLSTGALPANGAAAVGFKTGELAWLDGKGLKPTYVIGNTVTDAEAYDNGQIQPLDHRLFFQFGENDGGQIFGGRRFESYKTLLGEFGSLSNVCP